MRKATKEGSKEKNEKKNPKEKNRKEKPEGGISKENPKEKYRKKKTEGESSMKKTLQIIHLIVCICAIGSGYAFLDRFNAHIDNGIWDKSAITASAITICSLMAIAVHVTYYLSVHIVKGKE